MRVIAKSGREDLATVYLASFDKIKYIEFVESLQPPFRKQEKWVLIVSTLFGCPVGCRICDAGIQYQGKLTHNQILEQITFLIDKSYPSRRVEVKKFKIQFARMGEPAFNQNVLSVISELPDIYDIPGFLPSISTVAPVGCDSFFKELLELKKTKFSKTPFQLQFSIHSTDSKQRDKCIPIKKWHFSQISEYGQQFFDPGDRKISLNFALAEDTVFDHREIVKHFPKEYFLIKLTPVNPTFTAKKNKIKNGLAGSLPRRYQNEIKTLEQIGYQIIISIGELEENLIGSNCGQMVKDLYQGRITPTADAYSYSFTTLTG